MVDDKCMHPSFGEHGLSGFGVEISFQFCPNFLFGPWTLVHGRVVKITSHLESAQKIHASRG